MKIFTNTTFTGHYPVGTAAVVVAPNIETAVIALNHALTNRGLVGDVRPEDMMELIPNRLEVRILNDGNY